MKNDRLHNLKDKIGDAWVRYTAIFILFIITIPVLAMYSGMIISSLTKYGADAGKVFTLDNYRFLFQDKMIFENNVDRIEYDSIWIMALNTGVIAVCSMALEISVSLLGGYALSKGDFPGKQIFISSTFLSRLIPGTVSLISYFYIFKALGLLEKPLIGVILAKGFGGVAMSTWILKGFFDGIPKTIDHAAEVDGSTKFNTFRKIYLPAILPGIIAVSLFSFLDGWGEYVMLSVFSFGKTNMTLPIFLRGLLGAESTYMITYESILAIAVVYMVPAMIMYIFAQKHIDKMHV